MSGNCIVGMYEISEENHGNIVAINCKYNGEPSSVGKNLHYFFNERQRIAKLISMGDALHIGRYLMANEVGQNLKYNDPDICSFSSSVGDGVKTHSFPGYAKYINTNLSSGIDFVYLWSYSEWRVFWEKDLKYGDELEELKKVAISSDYSYYFMPLHFIYKTKKLFEFCAENVVRKEDGWFGIDVDEYLKLSRQ